MSAPIRVALVDDHPIVRSGFDTWLAPPGSGITVVAKKPTVAELLDVLAGAPVDVVLLDLVLADGSSVTDNVVALSETGACVLVISSSTAPASVKEAIRAGADGYVLKTEDTDEARQAVSAVARGESWISQSLARVLAVDDEPDRPPLSPQELRALQLYSAGLPLKLVAREMELSINTVKQYLQRVQQKYRAAGRPAGTKVELYQRALEDGHVRPPS